MTLQNKTLFPEFKKSLAQEKRIINELISLYENREKNNNPQTKTMISSQIETLKNSLKQTNIYLGNELSKISLPNSLNKRNPPKLQTLSPEVKIKSPVQKKDNFKLELSPLEKSTIKRLKKNEKKVVVEKQRKPNSYVKFANRIFSDFSMSLLKKDAFKKLKDDLIKANLPFHSKSYVSIILFTTFISFFASLFLFIFLLFFNISATLPIITVVQEGFIMRFLKTFWILFVIPISTFLMLYIYPSLEKKSAGAKIEQELPFATINMAAISGSMIDPNKIFSIIVSTKEYPYIQKEFIKLLNKVNLLGYDLVTSLRHSAMHCPSKKLSELFNGVATTINSGGDLSDFFNKRAETLLFEYKIEREKRTRAAETFMDIYISVVIAAPMILMLLLMMMKISGLGLQLSTGMISLIMVIGVVGINIGFLTFLHLKQSAGGE